MKLTKHKINKKINKNMIIRKNNKMQTNFVYNSAAKVETFISYPFAGTKRAGTRLTIKLSKVNKPYLNKGGKVRNYQDEVDNEY